MEALRPTKQESAKRLEAQLELMVEGLMDGAKLDELARAVCLGVSTNDDWEVVRASDLNALRKFLGLDLEMGAEVAGENDEMPTTTVLETEWEFADSPDVQRSKAVSRASVPEEMRRAATRMSAGARTLATSGLIDPETGDIR